MNDTKEKDANYPDSIDLMLDMLSWDASTSPDCDSLFHYYSGNSVRRVLKKDSICFRLAETASFEDKLEGKAVELFYDLALEELKNEGNLSEEEYDTLCKINVPSKAYLMHIDSNGNSVWSQEECEEYIICFSTEKDSQYMFDHYIGKENDGYCLEFFEIELKELCNKSLDNRAEIRLLPVFYGRAAIEFIKQKVMEVVTSPLRYRNVAFYIEDILHVIQFSTKRSMFSQEKEIRMVVLLPKNCNEALPSISFCVENGKKYIFLSAPKETFCDITPAPFNCQGDIESIQNHLATNCYPLTSI